MLMVVVPAGPPPPTSWAPGRLPNLRLDVVPDAGAEPSVPVEPLRNRNVPLLFRVRPVAAFVKATLAPSAVVPAVTIV